MKKLVLILSVLSLSLFGNAQTYVVPPAYATVDPAGTFSGPLQSTARTYMLLINENQLTGLVGMEITGLTFRSNSSAVAIWPNAAATFTNYDIYMGQGVAPANRSLTSITDNYIGTPQQVRSGSLTIPAGAYPAGGVSSFGSTITFTTPYAYNGGHIYLRISHDGGGESRAVNAVNASGGPSGVYGTQVSAAWQSAYSPSGTLTNGNAAVVQFTYTTGVPVTGVAVSTQGAVPPAITINGGSLQMLATVLPAAAYQGVNWSIVPSTGQATISATGLINPLGNGTVWAKAVSVSDPTKMDSMLVTISNQVVPITSLTVSTQGSVPANINTSAGTLQMVSTILPSYANQAVAWSIVPSTGNASISSTGLVTGISDGLVWAKAVSVADPSFKDSLEITLSNQSIAVTSIDVVTQGGAPAVITTNAGTLQLLANVLPSNASNPNVFWSVMFGTGSASVNTSGLLTAQTNGTVTVKATSVENNSIYDSLLVSISGQGVGIKEAENDNKFKIYPNPISNENFNINFEKGFVANKSIKYLIVDVSGKVLQEGLIKQDNTNVDLSRLAAGNYFLKLTGDRINAQRTIVKSK